MNLSLRNYQEEAVGAVIHDWNDGILDVVVAMATGLGKTRVGIGVLAKALPPDKRGLWLAHRDILIRQPLARLKSLWPAMDVGVVKAQDNDVDAQLVIGSVQTLCRPNRLHGLLAAGDIDFVVTDECHHSPSKSYCYIYDGLREVNPHLCHLGLTATPERSDRVGLRTVFQKFSYQKNIRWGIREGWLVPPNAQQIETGVSLSGVKVSRGDFVQGKLEDVLNAAGWPALVAGAYLKHCVEPVGEEKDDMPGGGIARQAIAFTPGVAGSKLLCNELTERGVSAAHIDGTTPQSVRRQVEKAFREREIQVVTNCAVYGEGADFPSTEAVLLGRPTQSHGLLTQMVGRGLRPFPGKEDCLVLLFATTGARILTIFDLGKSRQLKEAEEKAESTGIEGFSEPIPLFDEEAIDGVGLYARVVDLFGLSKNAWFRDGATFSLGLGEHEGHERTLVILPPNGSDDWQLVGVGRSVVHSDAWERGKVKRGPWRVKVLAEAPDTEELMMMAADVVERRGVPILSEKSKRWRKEPASDGQKRFARKWAPAAVVEGLTKGEAAQAITHGLALDAIRAQEAA